MDSAEEVNGQCRGEVGAWTLQRRSACMDITRGEVRAWTVQEERYMTVNSAEGRCMGSAEKLCTRVDSAEGRRMDSIDGGD
jgi:hypothetical protein